MSEVIIRRAHDDELSAVGELTIGAYRASGYVAEVETPYAVKLADARTRALEAELLVAVDADGELLGTVTVVPPGTPWAQVCGPDELEFRMLAVAPAARGRGIGEALTRAVLERAADLGLAGVALSSGPEMHAAHRLYERLGFRRTLERDWSPVPGVDLITYAVDL